MRASRFVERARLSRLLGLVLLALITAHPAGGLAETTTEQARRVIDFCLAHPDQCSLSIHHLTGGWERHLNPDRLNALASTWKVVPLLAYGRAVADGELDANHLMSRDEWGRFFVGGDGGALETAWTRLGKPEEVTLDQMVGAMMRESDNATPDWLYNQLGAKKVQKAIEKYFLKGPGFHDIPKAISSMFLTWDDNPKEPLIGDRIARDYSDFGAYGYRGDLDSWFNLLRHPAFVNVVRTYRCVFLPWVTPPPCTPPGVGTSETNLSHLQQSFYTRSNTRTYTNVMHGLLERHLLPDAVQNVIEHSLEWRLDMTGDRFSRYGAKSGTLGTVGGITVINWTTYLETTANAPGSHRGVRAALTLHLRGNGGYLPIELAFIRPSLGEALVEDPAFAEEVRSRIPEEVPMPNLVARLDEVRTKVRWSNYHLDVKVDVFNIGIKETETASAVALYLSHDSQLDSADRLLGRVAVKPLKPGKVDPGHIKADLGSTSPEGLFLITVVDPDHAVQESIEGDNIQWERLRP